MKKIKERSKEQRKCQVRNDNRFQVLGEEEDGEHEKQHERKDHKEETMKKY